MRPPRRRIREVHNEQVLRLLLRQGPLSRVDLAHKTGLTTAAITHITRGLIEQKWIQESGSREAVKVGARAILLDFPSEAPLIGVIHQAVNTLSIGICNIRGQVLAQHVIRTPQQYPANQAITQIVAQMQVLLKNLGCTEDDLVGIGAGLSGLVNSESGLVRRAPRIGWENVAFRTLLSEYFPCPIFIENNVRAMAFGEAFLGQGRNWPNLAFVYLGIGIGAGLIVNGRPYRGAYDGAGEIGHITVEPDGIECYCGNSGCLETILAEPAIVREIQRQGLAFGTSSLPPNRIVQELVERGLRGEVKAKTILTQSGDVLGIALITLVNLFNPSHIILYGTLANAGEIFFSSVSKCLQKRAFLARGTTIEIVPSTFGDNAGLVGAAAIAVDQLISRSEREH